jgi:hypothetical protein
MTTKLDIFTAMLEAIRMLAHNEPASIVLAAGLALAAVIYVLRTTRAKTRSDDKPRD